MKTRHAAALAFVGWYLMLLPKDGHRIQIFDVPWSAIQRSFDTAKDCEEARAKAVIPPLAVSPRPSTTPTPPSSTSWLGKSEPTASETPTAKPIEHAYFCVATNDPRLKAQ